MINKINSITPGPRGPHGPRGPPGPRGRSRNLCFYNGNCLEWAGPNNVNLKKNCKSPKDYCKSCDDKGSSSENISYPDFTSSSFEDVNWVIKFLNHNG